LNLKYCFQSVYGWLVLTFIVKNVEAYLSLPSTSLHFSPRR
jgi:hypothetical protein